MRLGNFLVRLLVHNYLGRKANRKKVLIRGLAALTILILVNIAVSCYYYRVTATNQPSLEELHQFSDLDKKFVVHQDYEAYYVGALEFLDDSLRLHVDSYYIQPGQDIIPPNPDAVKRYRPKKGDARLLNEVHLHVNENVVKHLHTWTVAISDIGRLDVYNHSTSHTVGYSLLLGVAMVPAAILVVVLLGLLVLALSGNSCPFIYTFNGEEFVFAGEIYSGAVYPPLERNDYLLLPELAEDEGVYRMKIANQLEEEQHTNLLELMVFDHAAGTDILVDKYGNAHALSDVTPPTAATNLSGDDILPLMEKEDDLIYIGLDPSRDPPLLDGVILTFDKPAESNEVKLVVEAKNSYWLDFVYQNFREMLGSSYKMWVRKQEDGNAEKMTDWSLSQHIPLSVYLLKDGEWVFQDYFHTVGPMAFKKDILPIDLKGMADGPVTIKLEAGSYFWEIGYVGLDQAPANPLQSKSIQLSDAVDEVGENVTALLLGDDELYYIQPEIGNEASLSFPAPEMNGEERTVILHSKGYYRILQDPKGTPKIKALKEIRKSGNFNVYSNELMQAMLAEHLFKDGKITR